MKKNVIYFVLGISLALIFGFTTKAFIDERSLATVDQEQGMYLFIRSKPAGNYEFIGKVNMPEVVWNGRPREMMNTAIRRARKQFPQADGIIFQSEDFSKVEAVRIAK